MAIDMFQFTYSGACMIGSGLLLSFFVYRRWREFLSHKDSSINFLYFAASGSVTAALFLYGVASLLGLAFDSLLPFLSTVATFLIVNGFGFFLRIPLSKSFDDRTYSVFSHLITAYCLALLATLVAAPPTPMMEGGIMFWNFKALHSALILILNGSAFTANIAYIYTATSGGSWQSRLKFSALILTFVLTGLGGGYLFFGNSYELLVAANAFLLSGVTILMAGLFFSPALVPKTPLPLV